LGHGVFWSEAPLQPPPEHAQGEAILARK
jgi:hypothetical protein